MLAVPAECEGRESPLTRWIAAARGVSVVSLDAPFISDTMVFEIISRIRDHRWRHERIRQRLCTRFRDWSDVSASIQSGTTMVPAERVGRRPREPAYGSVPRWCHSDEGGISVLPHGGVRGAEIPRWRSE